MYEEICYEVQEPIAWITLDRPEFLNAWTDRMGAEVKHAVAAAEADPQVVVIVITGSGRGWCAGADLKNLQAIGEGGSAPVDLGDLDADPGDPALGEGYRNGFSYMLSVRKPVIAAVNGPVAGMAVPISLYCDMRFASDRAVFTLAFSQRGLVAEFGTAWMLPRLVGPAHALDLLMSSRKVDAQEAERLGLVNRVVPHDELLDFVRSYAEEMAATCSPASMQIMKRQVYQQLHADLGSSYKEAVKLMVESFGRPDFKEGVNSFLERRAPRFPRV